MQRILKIPVLSLVLISSFSYAQGQDDGPRTFRINNIRSNGSGCPVGTVAVNVSDDQQAFTLSFSEFYAEVSPSVGRQQERKNCRVVFDTEQDAGWEYSILAVTYRGFAQLDPGVTGSQTLRFGGANKTSDATLDLTGPYQDDYINTREVPIGKLMWSGCKDNKLKDFGVDAIIALQAPDRTTQGLMTVDSVDGEIRQEYEVLWRECNSLSKKSYAVCRLSVPAKNGTKQLFSKAMGRNDNQALQKARAKMTRKCDKAHGRAPNCNANQAVCSPINL